MQTLVDTFWVETPDSPYPANVRFGPFAAILPFIALAGTAMSAVGSIEQGKTQAAILQQNANVARIQGQMTDQTDKAKQLDLSEQRRKMIGSQIAKYGGAGVDPGVGTPLDVMANTYSQYERDIQYTGYSGDVALTVGGMQANTDDWAAKNAETSGFMNAGTTLLTGVSKAFMPGGAGSSLLNTGS
jgi:hypothetical protein